MKSQAVRLIDVVFVGPYMLRAAAQSGDRMLAALGWLTIVYNGFNLLRGMR